MRAGRMVEGGNHGAGCGGACCRAWGGQRPRTVNRAGLSFGLLAHPACGPSSGLRPPSPHTWGEGERARGGAKLDRKTVRAANEQVDTA